MNTFEIPKGWTRGEPVTRQHKTLIVERDVYYSINPDEQKKIKPDDIATIEFDTMDQYREWLTWWYS